MSFEFISSVCECDVISRFLLLSNILDLFWVSFWKSETSVDVIFDVVIEHHKLLDLVLA